jgi:tetratricopeptide (TPR) repeat protein
MNFSRNMYLAFVLISFQVFNQFVNAQTSQLKLGAEERREVIEKISELMTANYVFAELGRQCGSFLNQQLEADVYRNIRHPRELIRKLNADMRGIHRDKHVRLQFVMPDQERFRDKNPILAFLLDCNEKALKNYGFKEVIVYAGNIGYLNIESFEPLDLARSKAINAMKYLENVDALIIDLRNNSGGNPAMVQYLSSYFFKESTHLNSCYWRRGDYIEEFWTFENIEGKKRPDLPLFVLISANTFSAAEEFANNLKTQQRATLIGEITAGGANPGYTFRINERFNIFIPTGHAINPITQSNWEGVGVEPDIKVGERKAKKLALEKALQAAKIYRAKENEKTVDMYMQLVNNLNYGTKLFAKQRVDSAKTVIDTTLTKILNAGLLEEWTINALAYRYLAQDELATAIALLEFNVSQYPHSANVYDSLGDAYLKNGDEQAAIENYKKSLQLDPRNQNAIYMLKKIGIKLK